MISAIKKYYQILAGMIQYPLLPLSWALQSASPFSDVGGPVVSTLPSLSEHALVMIAGLDMAKVSKYCK